MKRPAKFTTSRGTRVIRTPFKNGGETRYSDYYVLRVKRDRKNYYLRLGADKKEAGRLADDIVAFLRISSNTVADAIEHFGLEGRNLRKSEPKPPPCAPTVGEICERYKDYASHLSGHSVSNNCNALRHLAAFVLGLPKLGSRAAPLGSKKRREAVDAVPISELTLRRLEEFRHESLKAAGDDGLQKARTTTTTNCYLRFAKSLFSKRMMPFYDDFELPDPFPLHQVKLLPEPSHRYQSTIDLADIIGKAKGKWWDRQTAPTDAGGKAGAHSTRKPHLWPGKSDAELLVDDRACFVILLLTAACGLRPQEIAHLLWENVDFENRRINVAVTSYNTPKTKNSVGYVDANECVLSYLRRFREEGIGGEFVLPSYSPPYPIAKPQKRSGYLFKKLVAWLRQQDVDHQNPLYAFRKEAGSLVYDQTDSIDRVAEFLRNDPRVAREHYVGRKRRIEVDLPGLTPVGS